MRSHFEYIQPRSLKEALAFLGECGSQTSILAGGTDLMIAVRNGDMAARYVMDVSRLDELRTLEAADGVLWVGAAVTYTEIMGNPQIAQWAPILAHAAGYVGSVQIRNVGTLGGNVANASPAADSVPPMIVHRARVHIQSASSEHQEPLENVIIGPYRTNLRPDELITGFALEPLGEGYNWNFQRVARRRALSVARINAAAIGRLDSRGKVEDLRLSVGSITPEPSRMTAAEEHLKGEVPNPLLIREAAEKVSKEMVHRSGMRASTEYKRPAVEGLVIKALTELFLKQSSDAQ
ncbi:MAG: FAD binding domain-containing protein [Desulfomonilaceae bacterium]